MVNCVITATIRHRIRVAIGEIGRLMIANAECSRIYTRSDLHTHAHEVYVTVMLMPLFGHLLHPLYDNIGRSPRYAVLTK